MVLLHLKALGSVEEISPLIKDWTAPANINIKFDNFLVIIECNTITLTELHILVAMHRTTTTTKKAQPTRFQVEHSANEEHDHHTARQCTVQTRQGKASLFI